MFVGGASVQWLRDELKLISDSKDTEYFARKVKDSAGVYVVPAFVGLGAPYWDMYARGAILGLTRGANKKPYYKSNFGINSLSNKRCSKGYGRRFWNKT